MSGQREADGLFDLGLANCCFGRVDEQDAPAPEAEADGLSTSTS
ncbi:hypothetical protein [Streptomyces sp. NPDC007929]